MDAIVSGHAGVALLLDGEKLSSIHFGEDGIVSRSPSEVSLLFSGAGDLQLLRDVGPEEVREQLNLESTRIDALHLTLILLDADLSGETRHTAAEELEEMLSDKDLLNWLEGVLYAHPLPVSADLPGAHTACMGQSRKTQILLEKLRSSQETIAEVYRAWVRIPTHIFGSEQARVNALAIAVREGLFRALVKHRTAHGSPESLPGFSNPSWQDLESHHAIFLAWTSPLWQAPEKHLKPAVEPSIETGLSEIYRGRFCHGPPTDKELEAFLRGESLGRAASNSYIVRHLLAGCRSCQGRLKAARYRSRHYDYARSFAATERALADLFAEESHAEYTVEDLLQALLNLSQDDQVLRVGTEHRFAHSSFVKHIIKEGHAVRYEDPAKLLHFTHLACLAAESCTVEVAGSSTKLADLRAMGWTQYGNALRVQGSQREAEAALARAKRYLEEGTRDPLLRAEFCTHLASLRTFQRRFNDVFELADEAVEVYRELDLAQSQASSMVQKAVASLYIGEAEDAIHILNHAIPLIDSEGDPHLLLAACHNLIRGYIDLERPEQAMAIYYEVRSLYKRFNDPLLRLRTKWQEGQLLRDLGHLTAAEETLLLARQGFVERRNLDEVALISLDLAEVYVRRRENRKLAEVVAETVPIFRALGVQREALASLLQLQQLAGQEEQALELIGSLSSLFGIACLRPGSYR